MQKILTVRTAVQAVLAERNVLPQLVGGKEHLLRLHGAHWQHVTVEVGAPVGRNFPVARDRYDLLSSLLEDLGKSLLVPARICLRYGAEEVPRLMHAFDSAGTFCARNATGPLVGVDLPTLRAVAESTEHYRFAQLVLDVQELQETLQTISPTVQLRGWAMPDFQAAGAL